MDFAAYDTEISPAQGGHDEIEVLTSSEWRELRWFGPATRMEDVVFKIRFWIDADLRAYFALGHTDFHDCRFHHTYHLAILDIEHWRTCVHQHAALFLLLFPSAFYIWFHAPALPMRRQISDTRMIAAAVCSIAPPGAYRLKVSIADLVEAAACWWSAFCKLKTSTPCWLLCRWNYLSSPAASRRFPILIIIWYNFSYS